MTVFHSTQFDVWFYFYGNETICGNELDIWNNKSWMTKDGLVLVFRLYSISASLKERALHEVQIETWGDDPQQTCDRSLGTFINILPFTHMHGTSELCETVCIEKLRDKDVYFYNSMVICIVSKALHRKVHILTAPQINRGSALHG